MPGTCCLHTSWCRSQSCSVLPLGVYQWRRWAEPPSPLSSRTWSQQSQPSWLRGCEKSLCVNHGKQGGTTCWHCQPIYCLCHQDHLPTRFRWPMLLDEFSHAVPLEHVTLFETTLNQYPDVFSVSDSLHHTTIIQPEITDSSVFVRTHQLQRPDTACYCTPG
ncbi:hypothetical protein PR048_000885 [Dryococelus australis]|uniref:Uncharacterized protein n=1 Tax=Dryococelus australis TaxID=614101 RepID=A0ABQ9IFT5_9NEOP|nr:hypothetical protein PR048_000885 [Dryococelus australis]